MLQLAGAIAGKMLDAFFMNYFFVFLYVLVILFIRAQYQKYSELQSDIYGKPVKGLKEITEAIILTGLIAGFVTSFFTVAAGITIEAETIRYLFYIMCFLMIIDLRLLCMPNAAGILAGISLLFGQPRLNIPSLLCLVALVQLAESVLIYLNRKGDCIPVFIRHKDEITGAFLIRRFWMLPVVFFSYLLQPLSAAPGNAMEWSGILNTPFLAGGAAALGLDCLVAVLCHTDIAITKHPEKKSAESAVMLFCYSLVLLAVAYFSIGNTILAYIGVIFCVVAHGGIHLYSNLSEKRGKPIYSAVRRGLRVMDVLPGSHAERMGLQRGDVILSINNNDIQTDEGVNEALREFPSFTWIHVTRWDGSDGTIEYTCYPGGYNTLGIISVPREKEVTYNTGYVERMSILQNIVNRFRGMDKPV